MKSKGSLHLQESDSNSFETGPHLYRILTLSIDKKMSVMLPPLQVSLLNFVRFFLNSTRVLHFQLILVFQIKIP